MLNAQINKIALFILIEATANMQTLNFQQFIL